MWKHVCRVFDPFIFVFRPPVFHIPSVFLCVSDLDLVGSGGSPELVSGKLIKGLENNVLGPNWERSAASDPDLLGSGSYDRKSLVPWIQRLFCHIRRLFSQRNTR